MALAIELAATRYPLLGLDGLTAALEDPLHLLGSDDRSRQRSLRATIAWSVDLIDDDERAVIAACSVFAAGFTVHAAREIAWPDHTDADVARVLATLADQHLLRAEIGSPTTYRFQEVVRQYAAELLGSRAAAVELRHAQWAVTELTSLTSMEHDDAWRGAFDLLAVEVRTALARVPHQQELGERFAEELVQRGRLEEAQRLFEGLAAADATGRVRLLRLAAGAAAARLVGDEAMRLLDEASAAALAVGNQEAAADALGWSVIYATMYPGIMAHPPAGRRHRESAGRGPAKGSGGIRGGGHRRRRECCVPDRRRPCSRGSWTRSRREGSRRRTARSSPPLPSTGCAPAASCAGSTPTDSRPSQHAGRSWTHSPWTQRRRSPSTTTC